MKFKVVIFLSAICLLINFNVANAANIISGNNLRSNVQRSSTVIDDYGRERDFSSGYNRNGNDRSHIRSSVQIDANGNRQSTHDYKGNFHSGYKMNLADLGLNLGPGNIRGSSSVNIDANGNRQSTYDFSNGRGGSAYGRGGGAANKIRGHGNSNNVQTSIKA